MANEVSFLIKIVTAGEESVRQVTVDAAELGRVVKEVNDEQGKLNTKLLDINQAQQAIQNAAEGFRQITEEVSKLTEAFTTQEMAEVKLDTIMRQRMGTTEEDTEAIKRLAAAQQELGVIGDEVQLSGAQQMATFLNSRQALEELIPAMNNLLAQQKGLNATEQDAVSIGNMMGKAMQGQTQVLQRVGITFTDAQEQILKYGTEEQKAATLAQVITDNVGNMNARLAETDAGKAKQLSNTFGDLKEVLGGCLSSLEPFLKMTGEFGMGIQGIVSLTQGARGLAAAIQSITIAGRACVTGNAAVTTSVNGMTAAMGAGTVAAGALKIAIRSLMIATGIGAAVWVLTEAISWLATKSDESTKKVEDFNRAEDETKRTLTETRASLELNIQALKNFNGSKEQEKKLVEQMNEKYGESMGYFSTVAEWYNALVKNSKAYCEQMIVETRMRAIANKAAEAEEKMHDIVYNKDGSKKMYSTRRDKQYTESVDRYGNRVISAGHEVVGSSQKDKAVASLNNLKKEAAAARKEMEELTKKSAQIKMPVMGSGTRPGSGKAGSGKSGKKDVPVDDKKVEAAEGSLEKLQQRLTELKKKIEETGDADLATDLVKQYKALETELKEQRIKIGLDEPSVKEIKNYKEQLKQALAKEMKVLGKELPSLELKIDTKKLGETKNHMRDALNSVQELGSGLGRLGDAIGVPELNVAGTMAQAIATMVDGYGKATAQAADMGPWAWIAFAATGLAQLGAMVSSVRGMAKFADGGVVYGPTLALMGEYANASNDPEVISPLSKLQQIVGGGKGETTRGGITRLRARDILIALGNEMRMGRKSGRKYLL